MPRYAVLFFTVAFAGCCTEMTLRRREPSVYEASAPVAKNVLRPIVRKIDGARETCDRLRAEEHLTEEAEGPEYWGPYANAPLFSCDREHGIWAVRWDPSPDGRRPASLTVLHPGATGTARTSVPVQQLWTPSWPKPLYAFDYDGDGEPELFYALTIPGYVESIAARVFVTFQGGRIVPYAPANGLPVVPPLEDIDGDGRPDLRLEYELGEGARCDWIEGRLQPDVVALVAHSLRDGTFSLSDGVARRAFEQRYQCPKSPPRAIVIAGDPSADDVSAYARPKIDEDVLVCALLRGTDRRALRESLDRTCAPLTKQTDACKGPCRYLPDVQHFTAFDPPVVF